MQVGGYLFLGMFILYAVVMLLMFPRGAMTRYEIDDSGIYQYTLYKKRKLFKWLGLLGMFSNTSAGYTAAGAALLADARDTIYIKWDEVTSIERYPYRGEIRFKNNWRTVMQVFCTKEKYEEVLKIINENVVEVSSIKREIPFAYKFFISFFTLLFGIFLLPALPIDVVPIFTLVMIFSLLFAIWTEGIKKTVSSILVIFISVGSVSIPLVMKGAEMSRAGSLYALILELLFYAYFVYIALYRLRS